MYKYNMWREQKSILKKSYLTQIRTFSSSFYNNIHNYQLEKFYPHLLKNKAEIIRENKNLSGVYIFIHKESNKIYIGSSLNIGRRLYGYFSKFMLRRYLIINECLQKKPNYYLIRYYSTHNTVKPLHPWFVTGFAYGESSFGIIIFIDNNFQTNWKVQLFFQIILHEKDKILLVQIQNYFAVGYITKKRGNAL